jgi:hypothetical protein
MELVFPITILAMDIINGGLTYGIIIGKTIHFYILIGIT